MGNNPSSTAPKPASTSSPSPTTEVGAGGSAGVSKSTGKRDSRNIIPVHPTQRVAAPPEESLAQATRTSVVNHSRASLPQPASSLTSGTSPASTSAVDSNGGITGAVPVPQQPKPPDGEKTVAMDVRDEPSKPVDVPASGEPSSARSHHGVEPPPLVSQSSITDMSYLTRPPRLPLPIEEEVHTPGSPIVAPTDTAEPVGDIEALDSDTMARKTSALSNTTIDEDEAEELIVDKTQPSVPTKLEWKRGGERVYVTGSIFQWNKKHRLTPVEGKKGVFASTIHIHPGVHHVRFLVDGIMQTSPDLPTTVDFGNNLVNYIEVSPDDVPALAPGAVRAPTPTTAEKKLHKPPSSASQAKEQKLPRGRSVLPADAYFQNIPAYLIDFDQSEDTPAYQYAVTAIEKLSSPPGLPQFLSKPILNASASIKDDNSVLIMPNHTVLNHLGTSSIKNNILALSATTRYKHKYVTTIIYKPAQ